MKRLIFFSNVKSDRDFSATTGLKKEEFYHLNAVFSTYYSPNSLEGILEGFGRQTVFQQSDEALFFLLYQHKTAVTYDVLGLNFGISRAAAHTTTAFSAKVKFLYPSKCAGRFRLSGNRNGLRVAFVTDSLQAAYQK